jgi:hypothetical protein
MFCIFCAFLRKNKIVSFFGYFISNGAHTSGHEYRAAARMLERET